MVQGGIPASLRIKGLAKVVGRSISWDAAADTQDQPTAREEIAGDRLARASRDGGVEAASHGDQDEYVRLHGDRRQTAQESTTG